ncbi:MULTISPECIES: response regulator [Burkholderiaceae]|uniref:response regulator n=1 Tax=Burkholderiaceae TaxID=119060 RepID=UPI00045AC5ED|nr:MULTISPECIES: response regulator [Burkholderiaceae]KAK43920.1 chemotaxis protein CheY [Caballeronia jiangsuensis]
MKRPILVVEDNAHDRELTIDALEKCGVRAQVETVADGLEAQQYLRREGRFAGRPAVHPSLILLDMKLPAIDRVELLGVIRSTPSIRFVPVVALATSARAVDIAEAYEHRVNAYVVKAFDLQAYVASMAVVVGAWSRNRTPHY